MCNSKFSDFMVIACNIDVFILWFVCFFFFFFFQAEDGIRDADVTGVQTCALPDLYLIYLRKSRQDRDQELLTGNFDTLQRHRDALLKLARDRGLTVAGILEEVVTGDTIAERPRMQERSEERRVGKECRSRWSPDH